MIKIILTPIRLFYYLTKNVLVVFFNSSEDKKPDVKKEFVKTKTNSVKDTEKSTKKNNENQKSSSSEQTSKQNYEYTNNYEKSYEKKKTDSEMKGQAFEEFIISRVNKNYKLKDWRGDKYINGIYAESTLYPDLEFEVQNGNEFFMFAIECKWRNNFYYNELELFKESQLINYWKFAAENNIPVFVAIGVGGQPSSPEELYIIPLKRIKGTIISKNELHPFIKTDYDKIKYDYMNKTLI